MQTPSHSSTNHYQYLDTAPPSPCCKEQRQPINAWVVTEQTALYNRLATLLDPAGYQLNRQPQKNGALQQASLQICNLFLIDSTESAEGTIDLCIELRRRTLAPIILLTDLYQMNTVVQAFEVGVDQVIKLPFHEEELRARIAALMRRISWTQTSTQHQVLSVGPICFYEDTRTVVIEDRVVPLLPLEYRLLRYLMQHANRAVSKAELGRELWNRTADNDSNFVEVAIRRLRHKIEATPSKPKYLVTQYGGEGYKLQCP
jgi:DNA-binding response OmpR family regulator